MHSKYLFAPAKTAIVAMAVLLLSPLVGRSQQVIALYSDSIPNSKKITAAAVGEVFESGMYRNVSVPTLEIYLPEKEKATGAAVVICPGGGYSVIVYQGEGISTAKELARNGIAAFVLKYRLPDDARWIDKTIAPLQDAQQAIKRVRENASEWGLDVNKIGIMGFSAGGHLASTVATHYQKTVVENINQTSLRPDFQILVYPVISMQEKLTHMGSRNQLLGQNPTEQTIDGYSGELQVDENTPPAYITHTADDTVVDVDNSIGYFEALRHHQVPVEMHIYPHGGHGFVFGRQGWMNPLLEWFVDSKIITKR